MFEHEELADYDRRRRATRDGISSMDHHGFMDRGSCIANGNVFGRRGGNDRERIMSVASVFWLRGRSLGMDEAIDH